MEGTLHYRIAKRLHITAQTTTLAQLIGNVEAQFKISCARSMPPYSASLHAAARRGLCTRWWQV